MKSLKKLRKLQSKKPVQYTGSYLFKNITNGELILPRPTEAGVRAIPRNGQFIGDSYYLMMVPSELRNLEDITMQKSLITEQPPIITTKGTVEYVQINPALAKLNEIDHEEKVEDVLITENPLEGVEIIRD